MLLRALLLLAALILLLDEDDDDDIPLDPEVLVVLEVMLLEDGRLLTLLWGMLVKPCREGVKPRPSVFRLEFLALPLLGPGLRGVVLILGTKGNCFRRIFELALLLLLFLL